MNKHIVNKKFKQEDHLTISRKTLSMIKKYLRSHNVTISDFNNWMKEELNVPQKDRIIIMDWVQLDLDGFLGK